jgi:hypothetical protein
MVNGLEKDDVANDTGKRPRKLKWMKVSAVALVDYPANRRKFLLCKREEKSNMATEIVKERGLGEIVGDVEACVEELRTTLEQVAGPKNAALTKEEFNRFASLIVKMQDISKCIAEPEVKPDEPKKPDEEAAAKKLADEKAKAEADVTKAEEIKKAEADVKAKADAEIAAKKQADESAMSALTDKIAKLEAVLAAHPTADQVQRKIAEAFGR